MSRRITEEDLVKYDFDCKKLKDEGGFDQFQLRDACFDVTDLKEAGFTPLQLRCASFDAQALHEGGFSAVQVYAAGFGHRKLRLAGYTARELHDDLECTIKELKEAGYTAADLKTCGFHGSELRQIGFTVAQLLGVFTNEQLVRAGFTKAELKPLGAWPHDGQWQTYNQYWNCCYNLDKASIYCEPLQSNLKYSYVGSPLKASFSGPAVSPLSSSRRSLTINN